MRQKLKRNEKIKKSTYKLNLNLFVPYYKFQSKYENTRNMAYLELRLTP